MTAGWLAAAFVAAYLAMAIVAVRRLLYPGAGRVFPPPLSWMESRTLQIHGIQVHVSVFGLEGAGPVCILQHGLGESGGQLAAEAGLLRRLGFGIVLMDLPGHGRSSRKPTTYGARESDLLKQVIDVLGVGGRVTLLWGRSTGAAAVLRMAPGLPRVGSVILEAMFDNPLRSIWRHVIERPRYRALLPLLPGVMGILYLFLMASRATRFPIAIVQSVEVPLLFIGGSRDIGMPGRVQRRLLALATHPDSETAEVPGAGHYGSFAQAPARFEAWIARYAAARQELPQPGTTRAASVIGESRRQTA